jgi:hypothetical protein
MREMMRGNRRESARGGLQRSAAASVERGAVRRSASAKSTENQFKKFHISASLCRATWNF